MVFSNYSLVSIVLLGCSLGEILFVANEPSMEVRFVAWKYHLIGQEEYYRDLVQASSVRIRDKKLLLNSMNGQLLTIE
ncbi:MAG TPA: hypothetical protein VEO19_08910 [Terriglobia bacterium]|nr:hypothetical protein [Terriglobia bacterium]